MKDITIKATFKDKITPIEDGLPHQVAELICVKCAYRYTGVFPEGVLLKNLTCPKCEEIGAIILTGQPLED